MISKHVPCHPEHDNYAKLANYIADAGHEGEKCLASWCAGCADDDDYELAIVEAQAAQAMNTRSQKEKTYHLLVFRPEDDTKLTPEAFKAIEERFAAALGYTEHEYAVTGRPLSPGRSSQPCAVLEWVSGSCHTVGNVAVSIAESPGEKANPVRNLREAVSGIDLDFAVGLHAPELGVSEFSHVGKTSVQAVLVKFYQHFYQQKTGMTTYLTRCAETSARRTEKDGGRTDQQGL